jgi:hypothetical protein
MIGTISDRDIAIRAVAEGKDAGTKVRDMMSEKASPGPTRTTRSNRPP